MTDQSPIPPDSMANPPGDSPEGLDAKTPAAPKNSQFKRSKSALIQELPYFRRVPPLDENFTLIKDADLQALFERDKIDPAVAEQIRADLKFLDHELLRLFRNRDHNAKLHQNRYRLYQILYIILAAAAGTLGALQAVVINSNPGLVPWIAFVETIIAAIVTFLATLSGRESSFPLWLNNRRSAELMRREFFRFLVHLPPYDKLDGYQRRVTLSQRAADINRGVYPQEVTSVTQNAAAPANAGQGS